MSRATPAVAARPLLVALGLAAAAAAAARPAAAQGRPAAAPPGADLALPAIAPGDSATPAAVERLLAASDAERAYARTLELGIAAQVRATPQLAPHVDLLRAFMTRHAGYAVARPDLVRAYRETFTAAEVAELTQFYGTDLGRRLAVRLPLVTARTTEVLTARLQPHLPELFEQVQARLQGGAAPPEAASGP